MNKIYVLLIILAFGCVSCGDFLEEDSQTLSYVTNVDDLDELLVGSGYLQNARGTYYIMTWLEVMDDDIQQLVRAEPATSSTFGYLRLFYQWAAYPWDDDYPDKLGGNRAWERLYESIGVANVILNDIERFQGEEGYERVKGEAYFIRAYCYFYLVNIFGHPYDAKTSNEKLGVPIKLTDYVEVKGFARNSVEECYQQILSDLRQAVHYLDGVTPTTTFRAGENAARALLAKTALYMGDWETVVSQCDSILDSPKGLGLIDFNTTALSEYATASSYNAMIRSNSSSEAIFAGGFQTSVLFFSGASASLKENLIISTDLLTLYDENDLRYRPGENSHFFMHHKNGYYASYRGTASSKLTGNSLLFSEVYLNKAEALALLGRESEAISVLQELRKKRMTDAGSINASGESLVKFIREERRRELCFAGQRWFDLRRYGMPSISHDYKIRKNDPWVTYTLQEEDPLYTLPISTVMMNNNVQLEQNASANESERTGSQKL